MFPISDFCTLNIGLQDYDMHLIYNFMLFDEPDMVHNQEYIAKHVL